MGWAWFTAEGRSAGWWSACRVTSGRRRLVATAPHRRQLGTHRPTATCCRPPGSHPSRSQYRQKPGSTRTPQLRLTRARHQLARQPPACPGTLRRAGTTDRGRSRATLRDRQRWRDLRAANIGPCRRGDGSPCHRADPPRLGTARAGRCTPVSNGHQRKRETGPADIRLLRIATTRYDRLRRSLVSGPPVWRDHLVNDRGGSRSEGAGRTCRRCRCSPRIR